MSSKNFENSKMQRVSCTNVPLQGNEIRNCWMRHIEFGGGAIWIFAELTLIKKFLVPEMNIQNLMMCFGVLSEGEKLRY